jgi:ribosomal protein L29
MPPLSFGAFLSDKPMKMKEITGKTPADLQKMLADKRESLRVFRFGAAGAKTKNVKEGRGIRKDIARIMTALNSNK